MMAQVMELIYIFLSQMDDKVILFVTEIMVSGKKTPFWTGYSNLRTSTRLNKFGMS